MKSIKLAITSIVLAAFSSFAEEMPEYLKDSEITVKLKTGEVYKFSGNEYKVVKRGAKKKQVHEPVFIMVDNPEPRLKRRLTFHAGLGFDGLSIKNDGNSVQIRQHKAPVVGFTFSHTLDFDFNVSATVLSNETYLLGVGKDF
jgi:hypothetical protein